MRAPRKNKTLKLLLFLIFQLVAVISIAEYSLKYFGHNIQGLNLLLYNSTVSVRYDNYDTVEELLSTTVTGFTPNKTWKPGIRTNSRSFRTKEYTGPRDPSLYRIVTVGDSFNWGGSVNYNDTWSVELERRLNMAAKKAVEVFAIGISGTAAQFYLRLWELEKPRLRSDMVITLFFVGNDFTEERAIAIKPLKKEGLANISTLYRLIHNLYRLASYRSLVQEADADKTDTQAPPTSGFIQDYREVTVNRFTPDDYLRIEAARIAIMRKDKRAWLADSAYRISEVFKRFNEEAQMEQKDFLVVIVPDEFQVNETLTAKTLKRAGLTNNDIDLDIAQQLLKENLDRVDVGFIDLLDEFRNESASRRLYLERNTHWNADGHALAAEIVARYLLQESNTVTKELATSP